MAFSKTLNTHLLLPLFLLALALSHSTVVSQGITTIFSYTSFTSTSPNLIYQGDASIPSGSSFVRLTKTNATGFPQPYSAGRVMYSPQLTFWSDRGFQMSFQTIIKFTINTVHPNRYADGLTFFIVPVGYPEASATYVGGGMGIFNRAGLAPSSFAVEFDIFQNPGDPAYPHIGIDVVNSTAPKSTARFEGAFGKEVTATITYVSITRTISVVATYGAKVARASYVFDLKSVLPKQVQIGVSAATGGRVALFDIHAWRFGSTLLFP